jgi:hypothetical protein
MRRRDRQPRRALAHVLGINGSSMSSHQIIELNLFTPTPYRQA